MLTTLLNHYPVFTFRTPKNLPFHTWNVLKNHLLSLTQAHTGVLINPPVYEPRNLTFYLQELTCDTPVCLGVSVLHSPVTELRVMPPGEFHKDAACDGI